MASDDQILAALDKPRSVASITQIVTSKGYEPIVQAQLMKLRNAGKARFDIVTGLWRRVVAPT